MECKKRTPAIRFKGFTDAWEQRKFYEIFAFRRPDDYIVKSDKYIDGGITPVLTANKGFLLGFTNETRTYNKPSIIFDDFTLDCKLVDFPYMVKSSAIKILTANEDFDLRFAFELLKSTQIEVLGHARHYISVVQPTETFVPSIEEQHKIGTFFKQLDDTIANHQRELEKYKNLKISYLDRMFPKENSAYPELRFPEFTDAWEQRKLGDILKIKSGMSQKNIENPLGIYPILATGGIIGRTNTPLYSKESVLIGRKGTIDKPYYMDTPFWTVDTLFYSELSKEIYGRFIYALFQKIDWRSLDTSTGVPSLTSSTIHAINVLIPKSPEEQRKIGSFFKQLDDTIANHQRELEKYKKIKQAYLEKMFV